MPYIATSNGTVKTRRLSWPWGVNGAIAEIRAKEAGASVSFVHRARRIAKFGSPDLLEAALLGLVNLRQAEKVLDGQAVLGARGVIRYPS
jgi:hypothetical protein